MKKFLALYFVLFLLACGSETESNTASKEEIINTDTAEVDSVQTDTLIAPIEYSYDIQFGFANMDGNKILLLSENDIEDPEHYVKTIDKNGSLVQLTYEGYQEATPSDNGRQTLYNFEDSGGHVYSVNGKVSEWNTCILLSEEFLENRELIKKTNSKNENWSSDDNSAIEASKEGWEIYETKFVSNYSNNYSAHFVHFKPKVDSMLVSLVIKSDNGEHIYYDFPAIFNENSTWRVDDGGVFDYSAFEILAFFQTPDRVELITDWHGFEGSNCYQLVAENGNFHFLKINSCYRYTAPL